MSTTRNQSETTDKTDFATAWDKGSVIIPEKFQASQNSLEVFTRRYASIKKDGTKETPEEMCRRVAHALAIVETDYGKTPDQIKQIEVEFYGILMRKEFTPAGRTLTNAGTEFPIVANCIVLNIQDSMDSIFTTLRDASLLQQAGSGLGFPLHLMRPAGSNTKRSQGQASGPISFLKVYNQSFGVIKQQNRHGANMAVMRVDHPDILEFIHCKEKEGEIKNFNISVGLTNEFMRAVERNDGEPWYCQWKDEKIKPRHITRDGGETAIQVTEVTMTARELFDEIIDAAWGNGEPGCVFLDAVNDTNPIPGLGRIEACNPCGEQFLHDSDVCNLGSINLEQFVTEEKRIDTARLKEVTRASVRMLDNVIDISNFPAERVNTTARNNRRVGLGVMGFADMLYQMGVGYNTEEGRQAAETAMGTIQEAAHQMSEELAEEKGVFKNYDKSVFIQQGRKMRNAALTTVAPTGTISMLLDVSGGVEPYFALAYHYKGILGGNVQLHYVNKHLEKALKDRGLYSEKLMERIIKSGTLQDIDEVPEDIKQTFVVAMDISAEDHIKMQAAFQRHVDNSISKTINFPNSATKQDVMDGYLLAWRLGCKGSTVYRDGSREFQILNLNDEKKKKAAEETDTQTSDEASRPTISPRSRPTALQGVTYKINTAYGNLYITINDDEAGLPFEVFATIGKTGGFFAAQSEAICRLISLSLRSGIDIAEMIEQLKGIRGPDPSWYDGGQIHSLGDAIAQVLEKHIKRDQLQLGLTKDENNSPGTTTAQTETVTKMEVKTSKRISISDTGYAPVCPDCHGNLTFAEGCMSCKACGFSKCG
ncbi:MAG: adenosylcobalamin-dependent ribonucleoside-diphosphate reductase [bacterium]|nr:adenosylcobalamin-dependent ribonucleoside-diphosphate reductase [bacterium]